MRHLYTPFSNAKHSQLPGFKNRIGRGIGSVLLQTGGPGAGSSYPSVASYIETTGRDIFSPMSSSSGRGVGTSLKSKIQALMPTTKKGPKRKNINFSL
jgi:hypothetical protein